LPIRPAIQASPGGQIAQPIDDGKPDGQRKSVLRAFRISGFSVHRTSVDEMPDDLNGVE